MTIKICLKKTEKLKKFLCNEPELHIYGQGAKIQMHTGSSKVGCGACLLQYCSSDGIFHPVSCILYVQVRNQHLQRKSIVVIL